MGLPEKRGAGDLAREVGGVLVHWVRAQFLICAILTAIYAVGFAIIRVPVWPLLAVLCGFGHAIPMFGAVIAIVIAAGVTWISRGFYPAMGVMGVFAAAQALEGFYLTPKIMGKRLNMSPWLVFFGVIVASSLFGFVGMVLVIPVMAVALVVWRFAQRRRPG